MSEYPAPVDYMNRPLAVGARVTYISDEDRTLTTGTVAYLSDDYACIDSGGLLTVRKAHVGRANGNPVVVKYLTVALLDPGE